MPIVSLNEVDSAFPRAKGKLLARLQQAYGMGVQKGYDMALYEMQNAKAVVIKCNEDEAEELRKFWEESEDADA